MSLLCLLQSNGGSFISTKIIFYLIFYLYIIFVTPQAYGNGLNLVFS